MWTDIAHGDSDCSLSSTRSIIKYVTNDRYLTLFLRLCRTRRIQFSPTNSTLCPFRDSVPQQNFTWEWISGQYIVFYCSEECRCVSRYDKILKPKDFILLISFPRDCRNPPGVGTRNSRIFHPYQSSGFLSSNLLTSHRSSIFNSASFYHLDHFCCSRTAGTPNSCMLTSQTYTSSKRWLNLSRTFYECVRL